MNNHTIRLLSETNKKILIFYYFIHLFITNNRFFLVRFAVRPEPIWTLGARQEYTLNDYEKLLIFFLAWAMPMCLDGCNFVPCWQAKHFVFMLITSFSGKAIAMWWGDACLSFDTAKNGLILPNSLKTSCLFFFTFYVCFQLLGETFETALISGNNS